MHSWQRNEKKWKAEGDGRAAFEGVFPVRAERKREVTGTTRSARKAFGTTPNPKRVVAIAHKTYENREAAKCRVISGVVDQVRSDVQKTASVNGLASTKRQENHLLLEGFATSKGRLGRVGLVTVGFGKTLSIKGQKSIER